MTENEAIERIKTGICCEKGTVRYCTDACMYGKEKCAYSVAIKALKEIQQYRELEKRLTGMFSGELSLETVVDELERQGYFTASKKKNEIKFENNSKEQLSSVLIMILQNWKQHIYYLNKEENRYLAELRDALLPELMGGKIDL